MYKKKATPKYFPITADLFDLLFELGHAEKKGTGDFVICPR